jgi:hypothetical protein
MVGNRPVGGVRNPVRSTSSSSYLRAKNAGTGSLESGKARPNYKPNSEPCPAAGGSATFLNEKKY